jgi:hypothetical protein
MPILFFVPARKMARAAQARKRLRAGSAARLRPAASALESMLIMPNQRGTFRASQQIVREHYVGPM